ncbi:hypothetical protein L596_007095 [Steinernema carpocapsae]|nr:hypothetical protein L596_007095 [Steinernema carpocapsae]
MVLESRSGLGAGLPVEIPESIGEQAEHVLFHGLPVSVHTILAHEKCRDERRAECPNAIQVEVWTIRVDYVREASQKLLQPLFLKQAVRSHLHFSQLNSWVANNRNRLPNGMLCSYRLSLSDHLKNEELLTVASHQFPQCLIDRHHQLTVTVKWVKREEIPALPPQCVFEKLPFDEWDQPLSPSDSSPPATPHFFISPEDERESPCCRDREVQNPPPAKRLHRSLLTTPPSSAESPFDGVSSIAPPEDGDRSRRTPEGVISQSTEVEVLADFLASSSTISSIGAARISPSGTSESVNDDTPRRPRSLNIRQRRNTTGSVERNASDPSLLPRSHGLPLHQPYATFNRRTGLPLNSSPAPMKRNERSFASDMRLERLRRVSQFVDDSSGSDGETAPSVAHLARSPTSGNGLLCNFEESVLNGRLEPLASIAGFRLQLAANGSFTSPHLNLPVTTFFFNITDDAAPSPYLGHCSLEEIGRKGYHIPKRGTVQATLFNPQGTVVKIFVVKIDLPDMPASSQTFIRQRSFFMPFGCRLEDAQRSWLKYLIHLRLATDRAGRLFIHTDIRILFSNKSDLDSLNLENNLGTAPADRAKFQLTTFTEMPQRPKYSPVK